MGVEWSSSTVKSSGLRAPSSWKGPSLLKTAVGLGRHQPGVRTFGATVLRLQTLSLKLPSPIRVKEEGRDSVRNAVSAIIKQAQLQCPMSDGPREAAQGGGSEFLTRSAGAFRDDENHHV